MKVLIPATFWFPVFITPPAARTLVKSVTSAFSSILVNLVLSTSVIIFPLPELVTSVKLVTLLVVYTPLVTVAAFPLILPEMVSLKVFVPDIV